MTSIRELPNASSLEASPFASLSHPLRAFADELLAAPFRAVGPKTVDRVLDELLIDSLAPVALGLTPSSPAWLGIDLGCGPGIPLIPLALATPGATWIGVDSARKRLDFVSAVASRLGLQDRVRLQEERVGVHGNRLWGVRRETTPRPSLQPLVARADLVVARGTAPVVEVVAMASGLLSPTGRLLVFCTAESAASALEQLSRTGWNLSSSVHAYRRASAPDRAYAILMVESPRP